MSALPLEVPGLDRVRHNFVALLEERVTNVSFHALAAWDGDTAAGINVHLEQARAVLHQIAGTAGTVGYPELGAAALRCEELIIDHLEGPNSEIPACPAQIIWCIDAFVEACTAVCGGT